MLWFFRSFVLFLDLFSAIDCSTPPDGCTASDGTNYNDKAHCDCEDGHIVSGNTMIVCRLDGTWSTPSHDCTGKCFCR